MTTPCSMLPTTPEPPQLGTPFQPAPPKQARSSRNRSKTISVDPSSRSLAAHLRRDTRDGKLPRLAGNDDVTTTHSQLPPLNSRQTRHTRGSSHVPYVGTHGLYSHLYDDSLGYDPLDHAIARPFGHGGLPYGLSDRPAGLPISAFPGRFDWLKTPQSVAPGSESVSNLTATPHDLLPYSFPPPAAGPTPQSTLPLPIDNLSPKSMSNAPDLTARQVARQICNQLQDCQHCHEKGKWQDLPPDLDITAFFPHPKATGNKLELSNSRFSSPEKIGRFPSLPISNTPISGMLLNKDPHSRSSDHPSRHTFLNGDPNLPIFSRDGQLDAVWEIPSTAAGPDMNLQKERQSRRRINRVDNHHSQMPSSGLGISSHGMAKLNNTEVEAILDIYNNPESAEPTTVNTHQLRDPKASNRLQSSRQHRSSDPDVQMNGKRSKPLHRGLSTILRHNSSENDADLDENSTHECADRSKSLDQCGPLLQPRDLARFESVHRSQADAQLLERARESLQKTSHHRRYQSQIIPQLQSSRSSPYPPATYLEALQRLRDPEPNHGLSYQQHHRHSLQHSHRRTGSVPTFHQAPIYRPNSHVPTRRNDAYSRTDEHGPERRLERTRAATLFSEPSVEMKGDPISRPEYSTPSLPRRAPSVGPAAAESKRKLMAVTEEEKQLLELMRARRTALNGLNAEHEEIMQNLDRTEYGQPDLAPPNGSRGLTPKSRSANPKKSETEERIMSPGRAEGERPRRTRNHRRTRLTTPPPIPTRTSSMGQDDERRLRKEKKRAKKQHRDRENGTEKTDHKGDKDGNYSGSSEKGNKSIEDSPNQKTGREQLGEAFQSPSGSDAGTGSASSTSVSASVTSSRLSSRRNTASPGNLQPGTQSPSVNRKGTDNALSTIDNLSTPPPPLPVRSEERPRTAAIKSGAVSKDVRPESGSTPERKISVEQQPKRISSSIEPEISQDLVPLDSQTTGITVQPSPLAKSPFFIPLTDPLRLERISSTSFPSFPSPPTSHPTASSSDAALPPTRAPAPLPTPSKLPTRSRSTISPTTRARARSRYSLLPSTTLSRTRPSSPIPERNSTFIRPLGGIPLATSVTATISGYPALTPSASSSSDPTGNSNENSNPGNDRAGGAISPDLKGKKRRSKTASGLSFSFLSSIAQGWNNKTTANATVIPLVPNVVATGTTVELATTPTTALQTLDTAAALPITTTTIPTSQPAPSRIPFAVTSAATRPQSRVGGPPSSRPGTSVSPATNSNVFRSPTSLSVTTPAPTSVPSHTRSRSRKVRSFFLPMSSASSNLTTVAHDTCSPGPLSGASMIASARGAVVGGSRSSRRW